MMMVVVVFEEDFLRLICGHAPQSGSLEEKQSVYDEAKCKLIMHSAGDLAMCKCDLNAYIGRHIDGFNGVHRGFGVGQRNLEGRMLLEFCLE